MNASETYRQHRDDIARLIDVLQMELDRHEHATKVDSIDWGYVGEVAYVRHNILGAVATLTGRTPENVAEFLDDARELAAASNGDPGQEADPDRYEPNA
jgi:hypothetical protein